VQEQEGSTEDIFIHRTDLRGGYKTENTNTKHTYKKCKSYQKICKSLTIISFLVFHTFSNMLFGERCTIKS